MLKFKKYLSLKNLSKNLIDNIPQDTTWIISEKIKGVHLTFYIDRDNDCKLAKKTGFIKTGINYYNCYHVYQSIFPKIISLKSSYPLASLVIVYGELYGGYYPHMDVHPVKSSTLYKKTYYRPDNSFIVYDINVDGEFLPVLKAQKLCHEHDIEFVPIVDECKSFEDAIMTSNSKINEPSAIPSQLNLPLLEHIKYGHVIRPSQFLECQDSKDFKTGRFLFKHKSYSLS